MRSVEQTGERFEWPAAFDLVAEWDAWSDRFEASMFKVDAVVRLSPGGRRLATMLLQPNQARSGRDTVRDADDAGWATVTVPVESVRHGVHAILQLGAAAEVVAPPELRAAVAEAAAVTDRYAAD